MKSTVAVTSSSSLLLCLVVLVQLLSNLPPAVEAVACAGCVDLDELSFDRVVRRFPYALVKFDMAFPYGEKHEAFTEVSKAIHKLVATEETTNAILVGTVGIKDYGENENRGLGVRFDVDEKSFPTILLFRDGNLKSYVRFPAHLDVTVANLKQFITENSRLFIGRDGCVKQYEELVRDFANLDETAQAVAVLKAEQLAGKMKRPEDEASAKTYITFMQRVMAKGYDFVEEETKRLQRLRAGKVTDGKKQDLMHKLNILESFRVNKLKRKDSKAAKKTETAKEDL